MCRQIRIYVPDGERRKGKLRVARELNIDRRACVEIFKRQLTAREWNLCPRGCIHVIICIIRDERRMKRLELERSKCAYTPRETRIKGKSLKLCPAGKYPTEYCGYIDSYL